MNPLVIVGAVALIGFLATLGGAGADEGVTIINGNGGAGNGNGGTTPAPAPVLTATLNLETK